MCGHARAVCDGDSDGMRGRQTIDQADRWGPRGLSSGPPRSTLEPGGI